MLLRLRYEEDLTNPNVAGALGLSVANVKVRLHRLRPKLEQRLQGP
jgi:DNA-directed RNA polymerase specialized sigma24 family protein